MSHPADDTAPYYGGRIQRDDPRSGHERRPSRPRNKVGCITCGVYRHPANMVNVYDGEYQCQECRWGL